LTTAANYEAILPTANISIADKYGSKIKCRALLDKCRQVTLITEELKSRLKLKKKMTFIECSGIEGIKTKYMTGIVHFDVFIDEVTAVRVKAYTRIS